MLINVINVNPEIEIVSMVPGGTEKSKQGRLHRILSVVEQSKKCNLEIKFWEGVTSEKISALNINKAHKQIVADAKQRGFPCCCIAEDDFVLSCNEAFGYYLQNIPDDYDLYLAGVYSGQVKDGRIMNGWSGFTMYIVHERFYDFFLNINPNDHIDRALGNFCHEKMYRVVDPFCVYQLEGYSDNHRRATSHKSFLDNMKLFGR